MLVVQFPLLHVYLILQFGIDRIVGNWLQFYSTVTLKPL